MTITPATHPYGPHPSQVADLFVPDGEGPFPIVVLIHGGFWRTPFDRELMEPLAEDLAERGFAAWNIDYRRVGDGGGGEAWRVTLDDVSASLDQLGALSADFPLDTDRTALVGHSAGGHLALWLASEFQVRAAVSQAGVANLYDAAHERLGVGSAREGLGVLDVPAAVEFLGGTPEEVPDRYAATSPSALLPLETPLLLVHGDEDERVPISQSRNFAEAAREAGDQVELAEFAGMAHRAVLDPAHDSWARTLGFLARVLTPSA
ncbi:alpha/beta fold hydrolase [Catenulispora sp. NF23]|uniref:Alpha/beta fold hydrolase n=1 Tax=Catenulispora pinistramenti TaxID=2705254 RepID=A0ABS5L2L2_9ACTN|nr:alpha/beta fold hydrolase [Catenulispora pinistramenti]MBS2535529.1 alpha/beta fold hydrolase [Catenulispora pinistramenti]MBS2552575.1 alpha/beta fold hydrolase [Catenulispora pinistramenti]